jgi:nucleotide-binding universal stress UspA family protein
MFETIVWATDGSESADHAIPYVQGLARAHGSTVLVVHSKEMLVGRAAGYPALADEDELLEKIRGQVDALRDAGVDATLDVVTGHAPGAAHRIADAARAAGADMLIVGTRGLGPIAGIFLGSVTHRLLQISPCPVLAVPPPERPALQAEAETAAAAR